MAERNPLYVDEYGRQLGEDAPVPGAVRNVLDAARAGWNDTQFWTPEDRTWLDTLDPVSRKMLESNAGFVSSVLGAGNALYRGAQQAVVEGGNALDRAGVPQIPGTGSWSQAGRDFASIPDAFAGSPHSLPHVDVPGVVTQARAAVPAVAEATNALLRDQSGAVPLPPFPEPRSNMPREVAKAEIPGVKDEVSTRVPSSVEALKQGPDPHTVPDYLIDGDAVRASNSRGAYDANMAKVRLYPDLQSAGLSGNDAVAGAFMTSAERKLEWLHDTMEADPRIGPDGVRRGTLWYDGGNQIAHDRAAQYGLEPRQSAAVYATQSPQKDWYQNVSLGDRILSITHDEKLHNLMATPEMRGWMEQYATKVEKEIAKDVRDAAKEGKTYDPTKRLQTLDEMRMNMAAAGNGRLRDMNGLDTRAMWVRAYDEAHNPRSFNIVTPEGDLLGPQLNNDGRPSKVGWGAFGDIKKALQVLGDPDLANISRSLGENHKVRSFYNNLISPNSPYGHVTIDTHAVNAGHMIPMGGNHPIVGMGLGTSGSGDALTGSKGAYGLYADAYRNAASRLGYLPRQLQSITWEGVRGLFSDVSKRDKAFVEGNARIWLAHQRGELTRDEALRRVLIHSGGITPPSWLLRKR